jgi:hypothetical protein
MERLFNSGQVRPGEKKKTGSDNRKKSMSRPNRRYGSLMRKKLTKAKNLPENYSIVESLGYHSRKNSSPNKYIPATMMYLADL